MRLPRTFRTLVARAAAFVPLLSIAAAQQEAPTKWRPPESCIFTRNPVAASPRSIAAGRRIFSMRCAGCHGTRGRGDGEDASQLRVRPAVLASAAVQAQTDGALWWKISFGKRPMPGFGFRLSMKERWDVVNYLRTLRETEPAARPLKTAP